MPRSSNFVNICVLSCLPRTPTTLAMEIYVLSLPDDAHRRARLEASLAPYQLSYHWIEGVDARVWTEPQIQEHIDRKQVEQNMWHEPIAGSVGCYLSHLKAYKALLDSNDEAAVILEDDAEITGEFATHLSCLAAASNVLDVIFLCDRRPNRPAPVIGQSAKGLAFTFKRFANIGANGYVINRKAAALLWADYQRFGLEIDTLLNRWWQTGLSVATTAPELVTHRDMGSSIGYDNIRLLRAPRQRLSHHLQKLKMSAMKRWRFAAHFDAMRKAFRANALMNNSKAIPPQTDSNI